MSSLQSWNNNPKVHNTKTIKYNNKNSIEFQSNTTYLPRGLGRSYGDVCLNNDGSLILTDDFKSIINFDYENGVIECESGISLNKILKIITPLGWFLPIVPGTSFVTVGGAIANDIHGKNHHKKGTFGNFVMSIDLLRSSGEIITCTPEQNSDFFKSTIGGLGLTGLIIKAKIKLIPIKNNLINSKNIRYHSLNNFFEINSEIEEKNEYTVSFVDLGIGKKKKQIRGVYHVGNHDDLEENKKNFIKPKELSLRLPFPPHISVVNNFSISIVNSGYYLVNRNSDWRRQHYRNFFFHLIQSKTGIEHMEKKASISTNLLSP